MGVGLTIQSLNDFPLDVFDKNGSGHEWINGRRRRHRLRTRTR